MPLRVVALVLWLTIGCSLQRSALAPPPSSDSGAADGATDSGAAGDADADPDVAPDTAPTPDAPDIGPGCPPILGADCRWAFRMRLDLDNSGQDEDLTDFPVAVSLTAPRLDYAMLQDRGEDVRFVDASGSAVLPHEIEMWNETGRSIVWVRVPRIRANSAADHVWMYFGHPTVADGQDPGGVWSDGFELVWHMSGSTRDSTSAGNDGSNVGTLNVAGRVGWARSFDGAGQYVDSRYDADLATVTVEAWARGDDVPAADANVAVVGRNTNYQLNWDHFGDFRGAFGLREGGNWQAAEFLPLASSTWYYLAGTYDGATIRAFRDGQLIDENPMLMGDPDADTYPVRVGTNPDTSAGWFFSGRIDEVRISRVARSAAWIRAQHLSMTDAFITYGAAEPVTP